MTQPKGAVITIDGRPVLATAYGQRPICLCADLVFDTEVTATDIVRRARKWEITHVIEEYRDVVRECVPEARFDNYAPEDDNFSVRVDTTIPNYRELIRFSLRTHDYHIIHGDGHGEDMDRYLAEVGMLPGSPEAKFVREAEIMRKYKDLAKALNPLVKDGDERGTLLMGSERLNVLSSINELIYQWQVDMEIEVEVKLADDDFIKMKEFAVPFFRRFCGDTKTLLEGLQHPKVRQNFYVKLAEFESYVREVEGCCTEADFRNLNGRLRSFFDFEEAKEEQELLSMGLDPDWIKFYLELSGFPDPDIEILRRKYMRDSAKN